MIYLDYSATTPVNEKVLEEYYLFNQKYFANPNSAHKLGLLANQKIEETTKLIKNILAANDYEVIYTSGATEANNLAIKGFVYANGEKRKHIIVSPYEHSSVTTCMNYLAEQGFEIDVLGIDSSGKVDLAELEELITDQTILVSISLINSELGIKQDLEKIKKIMQKHPNAAFHSDLTQAIGKVKMDLTGIDLISFSGHKIYGLKGIGCLLRKAEIDITPVIHGGKSTSFYRGGTPPTPLIYSLGVALELAYHNFDQKLAVIASLKDYLIDNCLPQIKNYHLNYAKSIPQINNISFLDIPAHKMQKELSNREIYISTQTACNSESSFSLTVNRVTKREDFATTSVRVSLSHLTTKKELDNLILAIKEILYENN